MFRSILVPLDGSRFAEAALPIASRLARTARGKLHLVLAHTPSGAVVGMGEIPAVFPEADAELKQRELCYLTETAAGIGSVGGAPVNVRHLDGPAGPEVCEEASRLGADLVVMATHGRGAIGRLWLGSVADYVIRHLRIPVLLIRGGRAEEAPAHGLAGGIVVAMDLSPHSEAVLEPVTAMAKLIQSHVTLFHVVEPYYTTEPGTLSPALQDPTITGIRRADAQSALDRIADRLRLRGLSVSVSVVVGASAAGALIEALQGDRFGLAAMTTHGAGGMQRLLLGSIADKVIRASAKPVLVLRPPDGPEPE